jgi:hypothetical protein
MPTVKMVMTGNEEHMLVLAGIGIDIAKAVAISEFYLPALIILWVIGWTFTENAYTLHQFYRDRLGKAFLFNPGRVTNGEPTPLEGIKLSAIPPDAGPYHVINAALNVQGSVAANRRGRNADFFTFTRDFIGSDLTLYGRTREPLMADTRDMERADPMIDLASAMAISGAAISANMGGNTVRPLTPTLALLNIRLGYWLRNPRDLAKPRNVRRIRNIGQMIRSIPPMVLSKFYLLLEIFNALDENRRYIYLSDGGHIENLGIYQLLKRGCQLIIAVDAEADPTMSFPSLVKMERYARIDLGVRIDLPWEDIGRWYHNHPRLGPPAPHCAVGLIQYRNSEGILLYIKSSVSGDEPDYVRDYQKRNPSFPHETTGDQFFTEEQFEAYRALGFHAVDGALTSDRAKADEIALSPELRRRNVDRDALLAWCRSMVGARARVP